MSSNTKFLRERRAKAYAAAVDYLKNGLNSETRHSYDKAMDEVESLGREILTAENGGFAPAASAESRETRTKFDFAFDKYVRFGEQSLEPEERKALATRAEKRDQTAGTQTINQSTGSAGGFLVPAGFADEIEIATKWYAPLTDVCRTITTASGSVLPFPTSDDTGNEAALIGEASGAGQQDVAFSTVNLHAYKYTSKLVKVSSELLQDSAFNIYSYLADRFAERFGRAFEKAFTNGDGSSKPTGILTAIAAAGAVPVTAAGSSANDGIVGNTGANSIGSQDLVNLEHSVDRSYRRGAQYMFHDNTLGKLKGMLDKYGRPLWTPGVAAGEPDKINGYAYTINNAIPQISASNVTVVFGDFSKFLIRKVGTPSVKRLVELYAVSDEVGFLAFQRVDSNLIDAGQHPLNVLQQHS
jgi:HK97 family phage major capsid protein